MCKWQPSLRKEARSLGIPALDLNDCYSINDLLFISLEYDRIIKPDLFQSRTLYNIHFSLLPKYKGMSTSAWPILNGEETSGVTLHEIDHGIDTGAIIDQLEFSITGMSCRDLYFSYMENAQILFRSKFKSLLSGQFDSFPQTMIGSTYYAKSAIKFDQSQLNFKATAFQVSQQFRAYLFREFQLPKYEGTNLSGINILNDRSSGKPGALISSDENRYIISTVDFDVELKIDYLEQLIQLSEKPITGKFNHILHRVDDVDELGRLGWNALMVAAYNNNLEVVKLLGARGADLNAVNCNGTTILMYAKDGAERMQDLSVLQWLLSHGANPKIKDDRGKTVVDYCKQNNQLFSLNCIGDY